MKNNLEWGVRMLTRYKNLAFLLLATISLYSCASSFDNIPANFKIKKDTGVVLLSMTASGECGYAYFASIRNNITRQDYTVGMQDIGKERDWQKHDANCPSDPDDIFGKLIAIELPAGIYQIYQFEGLSNSRMVYSNKEMKIRFAVKPGVVNYLGNIHFHVNMKTFIYSVKDMRQRDIPYFLKRYPQFKQQNIIINPVHIETGRILPA